MRSRSTKSPSGPSSGGADCNEVTRAYGSSRGGAVSVGGVGVHSRGSDAVATDADSRSRTGVVNGAVSRGAGGGVLTGAGDATVDVGTAGRSKSNERDAGSRDGGAP